MSSELQGMVPGNLADAADYLEWTMGPKDFIQEDFHSVPRFFHVRLRGDFLILCKYVRKIYHVGHPFRQVTA
jgi:hypothetical protein